MGILGLTGIDAVEAEMRDRLKAKDDEIEKLREAMKGATIIANTSGLLLEANEVEIKRLTEQLVSKSWQPAATAPKDGKTFWAIEWLGNEEDSCHWALYWKVDHFECVETGKSNRLFTHWIPIAKFTHPDEIGEKT